VFGRRVKREAPWYMQVAYKAFYRVFDAFSYLTDGTQSWQRADHGHIPTVIASGLLPDAPRHGSRSLGGYTGDAPSLR
ncbi:MAG: hypothetical protein EB039_16230, partial [Proteobacteria bacterium]|nr:hypothetical protein [Pseudomonadota bacterium]